ncbi:MAG: hypothetical protein RIT11_776, partial [Pseudomonadota bacterium]
LEMVEQFTAKEIWDELLRLKNLNRPNVI